MVIEYSSLLKEVKIDDIFLKYTIDSLLLDDDLNKDEKIKKYLNILNRFNKLLLEIQYKLKVLQEDKKLLFSIQYDWYKFEFDKSLSQNEIETYYLLKDPKIIEKQKQIIKEEIKLDYIKANIDIIKEYGKSLYLKNT